MKDLLWLVPLFPLVGFLVNGIVYLVSHRTRGVVVAHPMADQPAAESSLESGHPHAHEHLEAHPRFKTLHTAVGVGSVALSCVFAFGAIFDVGVRALASGAHHVITLYRWISLGVNESTGQVPGALAEWFVDAAFRLDSLSALMIAFVTFVGFLIHVYSVGYMGHDPGYGRYFAYLNLFMFSMLVLVLADNFLLMFVGWEGVGLCSYLLIGYDYHKKFAADAGKKAFVVNRIGDFGFILGIFGVFVLFGTLEFDGVFSAAAADPSRRAMLRGAGGADSWTVAVTIIGSVASPLPARSWTFVIRSGYVPGAVPWVKVKVTAEQSALSDATHIELSSSSKLASGDV